ncbi:MAG: Hsp20/alpha crystallin family protein [Proteobacteria bacterium]|nr:Hsp20/alpha crystallin family protein [Pseudomonadota bacterium]
MFETLFGGFDADLFDQLRRLESEAGQLFGPYARGAGIRSVHRGTFPPINVGATPERVDVYLFGAGLDPKRIEVSIQQNLLTVSGSRALDANQGAEYYRRERYDGDFRRVVTLPDDVDPEKVEAKYRDGVLHVAIQRRAATRPRQITVS